MANNFFKAAVLIGKKLIVNNGCVSRSSSKILEDMEKSPVFDTFPPNLAEEKKKHREQFADDLEAKEQAEGRRDNPSLDPEVQAAIQRDYRALHEQIKAEGLYQCRYSEYAKESVRYGMLFAAFAGFLYCKWYLTSAIFLGLFWVCSSHPRNFYDANFST